MISTNFAPNETNQDAFFALKILFQPWKWRKGKDTTKLRQRLKKRFFSEKSDIYFYLTGRCALYHFVKSLNLSEGDEVILQAFTCEAVVLPILEQKLTPIYIDINTEDFSMNLSDLQKKLTPKAKVLILQHSFGITPQYRSKIIEFAKKNKLIVLEDLAHGFDTDLFNTKTMKTSLLLSFGRSKPLSGVFGGAIVTNNKQISEYLLKIEKNQQYPSMLFMFKMVLYKALSVLIKLTYPIYVGKIIHFVANYLHLLLPEISKKEKKGELDQTYIKAFPNISALFTLQQLNRFNDVSRRRLQITKYYQDKLAQPKEYIQAQLRFPYITNNKHVLNKYAKKMNIYFGNWYDQVIAPEELNLKKCNYKIGTCSHAELIAESIINLPTFVSKKQAQKIVKLIQQYDSA